MVTDIKNADKRTCRHAETGKQPSGHTETDELISGQRDTGEKARGRIRDKNENFFAYGRVEGQWGPLYKI